MYKCRGYVDWGVLPHRRLEVGHTRRRASCEDAKVTDVAGRLHGSYEFEREDVSGVAVHVD